MPAVSVIRDWVQRKIKPADKDLNRIAFFVYRKIKNEGTAIFRDNTKGIEVEKKIVELNNELEKTLIESAEFDLFFEFDKFQKQAIAEKRIR